MKTLLLTGAALELAKAFGQRCKENMERKQVLDKQVEEIRNATDKDMLDTSEAIKKELGFGDKDGIRIDASYLDEFGHVYAFVFENIKEEMPNGIIRFGEDDDEIPTPETMLN